MDGFSREVLTRLPLADAVLSLCSFAMDAEFLQQIYEEHRGRSYQSVLTFPMMVSIVSDALLEHAGSGRQAMLRAEERDELAASKQAAYGKLRRIPISLSNAFLARPTDRLRQAFPQGATSPLPSSLRHFHVIALDGKKIKRAAKRLKAARGYSGTPLGGKALVALDLRTGLVVAMNAHLDGETNDAPLVPGLLPQVRQRLRRRRLWVADRQFCDLTQQHNFLEEGDEFLVRYHPKTHFHRDANVPSREGTDSQGRHYLEEWGWLGKPGSKRSLYVRRITLFRDNDEDVILVTSLTDADRYPATDLMDAYLQRWGIEKVFQQVTEVFHLQRLISSTPQGTIFQFAFCLLLYNLIQVTRGYIARAQQRKPKTISSEMVYYDVCRQLISLTELADHEAIVEYFDAPRTVTELIEHIQALLADVWHDRWIKSPKKKVTKAKPTTGVSGGHTSIYRMIQASKRNHGARRQGKTCLQQ
ncbi:IS4/IS5 family transposase [Candidatus Parcubacteria bacterium]|nr:MAG: IS4/IS5 family transposase [Candidatus Parcubacteria bacterium]